MSETTPNPATQANAQPNTGQTTADKPLGENGEKALKAERERAAQFEKQAKDLQAQLDRLNQANESALEKAQREATEAKEAATKATTQALRYQIAAEKGIKDNVDLILTASDEDTMRKQADLWGDRQPAGTTTTAPGPRPDLSQGGKGSTSVAGDPAQDFANFLKGQLA